jgi:hypothetical protein
VTISDPDGVGYQKLELWDSAGTVAGGQFVVKGTPQSGGHEIDVAPANVANTVFDAETQAGTDMLWARLLQADGTLTAWQPFSVTVPVPTLTVSNFSGATPSQVIGLSSLVTISNPAGVGYHQLELWDSNGTAATGQFKVNGTPQTGGHEIDVTPANVVNSVFDVGTTGRHRCAVGKAAAERRHADALAAIHRKRPHHSCVRRGGRDQVRLCWRRDLCR